MNNEFSKWYLALLRKQVEEEIQFLVTNGHNDGKNTKACMFCVDSSQGYYFCGRLKELKRFLSSNVSHGSSKLRIEQERKKIGYCAEEYPEFTAKLPMSSKIDMSQLPLLSTKL